MKAKDLLAAAFAIRKGSKYESVIDKIISGVLIPDAYYIQEFDKTKFYMGLTWADPDIEFITHGGERCYLWKVDGYAR